MVAQHTPPTRPTPEQLESLLHDYATLHLQITELAKRHNLAVDELLSLVRSPELRRRIDAYAEIAEDRASFALNLALPMAVDRLVDVMNDNDASPESRRKAASQLIRLHTQRHRTTERRAHAPPTTASAVDPPAPRAVGVPPPPNPKRERGALCTARLPHTGTTAASSLPPLPRGEAALGEGTSSLKPPLPLGEAALGEGSSSPARVASPVRSP